MQLPKEIEELQHRLNSPGIVDGKRYRRNHGAYDLICHVNNLSGLLLSGNLEDAPIFIERARLFLEGGATKYVTEEYALLVKEYLQLARKHLQNSVTPDSSFSAAT